jgi:hypothetical protein
MAVVALLAPVPLEHLQSGLSVCINEGKVAFGSRAWEVFRDLDMARSGAPVDVYIYASGDLQNERLEASWYGRYVGHVEARGGSHPAGMRFRPQTTEKYPTDNKGHWAVFWELDQLRELSPSERIATGKFIGYKTNKEYKTNFVPEGPMLVIRPI